MVEEFVILVDENDNEIGVEEKVKCHLPQGKLHRAFTALLFDVDGNLVLTKRAKEKMLWPGDWDGTFASHPRKSETYVSSGERRMPEELGIEGKLDYLNKFEYHANYKEVGSENEICGTLIGTIEKSTKLKEIQGEIDEIKWISPKDLMSNLVSEPQKYCPWMLIALFFLEKSEKKMENYTKIFADWITKEMKEVLENAINSHISKDKWRFVNEPN